MKLSKEKIKSVLKTARGKWSIVFAVLAFACLLTGFSKDVPFSSGLVSMLLFLVVAAVFFLLGIKKVNDLNDPVKQKQVLENEFKPTKKVADYLLVDENRKRWKAPKSEGGKTVYSYSDLLGFDLIEDGDTITTSETKADLVSAVVLNPILAKKTTTSKASAICRTMQIRMSVNNLSHSSLKIELVAKPLRKDCNEYKLATENAQEILATLRYITNNV